MNDNKNFFYGMKFALKGQGAMLRSSSLWKSAGLPLLYSAVAYFMIVGFFLLGNDYIHEYIREMLAGLPSWMKWLEKTIMQLIQMALHFFAGAIIMMVCCPIFGLTAKDFIHQSTRKFEGEEVELAAPSTSAIVFEIIVLFFLNVLFLAVFVLVMIFFAFLPFINQLIAAVFLSYGLSFNCTSILRLYRPFARDDNRQISGNHFVVAAGYGFAAYLLFLIPLLGLFMLPGLFVGQILLLNYGKKFQ